MEKALAEAELRAECSRIASLPGAKAVDKTLLTLKAVADSLNTLQGEVIHPVEDALHQAFTHPCERLRFEGHTGSVRSVAFSPQGDRIVSGGADRTLRLWDLDGRQIGGAFEGHTNSVLSVAFSPRGIGLSPGEPTARCGCGRGAVGPTGCTPAVAASCAIPALPSPPATLTARLASFAKTTCGLRQK